MPPFVVHLPYTIFERILHMLKKIISLILSAVLAAGLLASCASSPEDTATEDSESVSDVTSTETDESAESEKFVPDPDPNLDEISVESENFSLSNADMSYIFQNAYMGFQSQLSQYGISPSAVGLDTAASLKKQECSMDASFETWFEYLLASASNEAEQLLALCELAKAAGIELDDEDKALTDSAINDLKTYAEENGYDLDNYIKLMYGESVDEATMRHMLDLSTLSAKYVEAVLSKVDLSDAALEAAYQENKSSYETVDYVFFGFDYKDIVSEDADEAEIAKAKSDVNRYAGELSKCRDKDSFLAYAVNNMIEVLGLTESEAENAKNQLISTGVKYSESSEVTKWAFEAEIGDIYTEESPGSDGAITIYLLTGKGGRNEDETLHDVRHILFLSETYEDDTEARRVYDEWVANGATLDEFLTLVTEYSEDPGSNTAGGLYKGVYEGQMVTEFNDWVFDPSRQHGDHGIVETSYGWHIMYYEDGYAEWEYDMKELLINDAYDDITADVQNIAVTFNDELLATISA